MRRVRWCESCKTRVGVSAIDWLDILGWSTRRRCRHRLIKLWCWFQIHFSVWPVEGDDEPSQEFHPDGRTRPRRAPEMFDRVRPDLDRTENARIGGKILS